MKKLLYSLCFLTGFITQNKIQTMDNKHKPIKKVTFSQDTKSHDGKILSQLQHKNVFNINNMSQTNDDAQKKEGGLWMAQTDPEYTSSPLDEMIELESGELLLTHDPEKNQATTIIYADGSQRTTYKDGSVRKTYLNKPDEIFSPEGTPIDDNNNNDSRNISIEEKEDLISELMSGLETTSDYQAQDNKQENSMIDNYDFVDNNTLDSNQNGATITYYNDYQIEHRPDQSYKITYYDQDITMDVQPNGSYVKTYPDGSVSVGNIDSNEYTIIQPDGTETTINDDDNVEYKNFKMGVTY